MDTAILRAFKFILSFASYELPTTFCCFLYYDGRKDKPEGKTNLVKQNSNNARF
jgi:hypothetical protein